MAISAAYIQGLLNRHIGESDGTYDIRDVLGEKEYKFYRSIPDKQTYFSRSKVDQQRFKKAQKQMDDQIDEMRRILFAQVHYNVPSFQMSDIIVTTGTPPGSDERVARFLFNRDAIFRPSVEQDEKYVKKWNRYAERNGEFGTDDIVLQLTKGYEARDSILYEDYDSGDWKWTRKSLPSPVDFVAEAVEIFNDKGYTNEEYEDARFGEKNKRWRIPSYARLIGDYR